jgi:hypothetical protein
MQVRDPHYSLVLNGDWSERPSTAEEQKTFHSPSLDILMVISSMAVDIPLERSGEAARILLEARAKAEGEAAVVYGHRVTITHAQMRPQLWGHMIAYSGSDDGGRHFHYLGLVTVPAIINLYVDSSTASEEVLTATMRRLVGSLRFVRD